MSNILTYRPPKNQRELLKKEADKKSISVNKLLINIAWDYLKKENPTINI